MHIDPIGVEDEDGTEEEDEEGGWNVNQPNRCSSLKQFLRWALFITEYYSISTKLKTKIPLQVRNVIGIIKNSKEGN